jgi:MFS transporter, Spinster family, sphingosine-1-phosphate transporter
MQFLNMTSNLVLFLFINLLNILINMDHGIVPAATIAISKTFDIGERELGFIGSIVFLGIVVSGLYAGRLYQLFISKWVLVSGLVLMLLSLLMFVLTANFYVALAARFLAGVFQCF